MTTRSSGNAATKAAALIGTLLVFVHGSGIAQTSNEYFPNTEQLRSDEMRVTALGTGLPTPLTRAQKSTAWMVELGNGDVFIFDIGTGSMENLFGLRPDFSKIDKIFLSHLHSDHFGDLDAFFVGSWLSGRYQPLHIYGGSGATPELGTKAACSRRLPGTSRAVRASFPMPAVRLSFMSSTTSKKTRSSTRTTASRSPAGRPFTVSMVR